MIRRKLSSREDALEPEEEPGPPPVLRGEPQTPPEDVQQNLPPQVDSRAAALLSNQGLVDQVRTALVAADAEFSEGRILDITEAVQTVRDKQKTVKRSLVEIGEALEKLWDYVGEGGYKALRDRGLIELTAGPASQYKSIAEAVREGRVSEDLLPNSMTAAYEVVKTVKANPLVGRQLLDSGVVRPTATKKLIEAKVRELLGGSAKKGKRRDPTQVRKRIEETKAELKRLEEMLLEMEREEAS